MNDKTACVGDVLRNTEVYIECLKERIQELEAELTAERSLVFDAEMEICRLKEGLTTKECIAVIAQAKEGE